MVIHFQVGMSWRLSVGMGKGMDWVGVVLRLGVEILTGLKVVIQVGIGSEVRIELGVGNPTQEMNHGDFNSFWTQ